MSPEFHPQDPPERKDVFTFLHSCRIGTVVDITDRKDLDRLTQAAELLNRQDGRIYTIQNSFNHDTGERRSVLMIKHKSNVKD